MADFDPLIWHEARHRLPLSRLMAQLGHGEHVGRKVICPFCQAKAGKFAVFENNGREFFKCHKAGCPAEDPEAGNSEVGYLALVLNLDARAAAREYLRRAFADDHSRVPHLFPEDQPDAGPAKAKADLAPPEPLPREGKPENPWMDLWQRLPLTPVDQERIMARRGFSPETIRLAGIRSNSPTFRPLVEGLEANWSVSFVNDR